MKMKRVVSAVAILATISTLSVGASAHGHGGGRGGRHYNNSQNQSSSVYYCDEHGWGSCLSNGTCGYYGEHHADGQHYYGRGCGRRGW